MDTLRDLVVITIAHAVVFSALYAYGVVAIAVV